MARKVSKNFVFLNAIVLVGKEDRNQVVALGYLGV
jgi:hypothetical protein